MSVPNRLPVSACPNCADQQLDPFGESRESGALHDRQSRCHGCGLVFANPRCDRATLDAYYQSTYYERHWPGALCEDRASIAAERERRVGEVERVRRWISTGRVLEIGASTGAFLAEMRAHGFDPTGVEPSVAAVEHGRKRYGIEIIPGTFEDAALPDSAFDLVYAWHVIEHVVDLDGFVRKASAVLKPGGILYLGTETWHNAGWVADRVACALRGRPAPYATSTEHTFVFTRQTLSDVLTRRGLRVLSCEAYQPTWGEKMRTMRFRHPFSRAWFAAQHGANWLLGTGPLLRVVAQRP